MQGLKIIIAFCVMSVKALVGMSAAEFDYCKMNFVCGNKSHLLCLKSDVPQSGISNGPRLNHKTSLVNGLLERLNENRGKDTKIKWNSELYNMAQKFMLINNSYEICLSSWEFADVRSVEIQISYDLDSKIYKICKIPINKSEIISNIGCSQTNQMGSSPITYTLLCLYNSSNRSTIDELNSAQKSSIKMQTKRPSKMQNHFDINVYDVWLLYCFNILVWVGNLITITFFCIIRRFENLKLIFYGD